MEIKKGQKIFISSTATDLIDIRAELLHIIPKWGFVALGYEEPGFPKPLGINPHDICLKAVDKCDILLLIIGGKYGSLYEGIDPNYRDKGLSITRCEADLAYKSGKGFITFIRDTVWNEWKSYNSFLIKGNSSESFPLFYVDDYRIFEFIDETVKRKKYIDPFNNSVQLKEYLKGQLTGESSDIFNSAYFRLYDNEG